MKNLGLRIGSIVTYFVCCHGDRKSIDKRKVATNRNRYDEPRANYFGQVIIYFHADDWV